MKKIFNFSGIKKVFEKILEPKGFTRIAVCCFLFVLILAIPAIFYEVVYAKNINLGEADDTVYIQGNIGIGTSSTGYKLDVQGTGLFTGDLTISGASTNFRNAIKAVDGAGSGIDADLLDGISSGSLSLISGATISESASSLAVGWYTVAVNAGNRAIARLGIRDTASGHHQSALFYASHHFGNHSEITILHS